jgi:hypothetical protein
MTAIGSCSRRPARPLGAGCARDQSLLQCVDAVATDAVISAADGGDFNLLLNARRLARALIEDPGPSKRLFPTG